MSPLFKAVAILIVLVIVALSIFCASLEYWMYYKIILFLSKH